MRYESVCPEISSQNEIWDMTLSNQRSPLKVRSDIWHVLLPAHRYPASYPIKAQISDVRYEIVCPKISHTMRYDIFAQRLHYDIVCPRIRSQMNYQMTDVTLLFQRSHIAVRCEMWDMRLSACRSHVKMKYEIVCQENAFQKEICDCLLRDQIAKWVIRH